MPIFVAVPGSHLKHKQNVRTREQKKKKKAQAQAQRVTIHIQEVAHIQEMDHIQEVKHSVQISVKKKAGKHVVLQRVQSGAWKMATSPQHAVISCFEMASFIDGLIMVQNGAICMPRTGVG